MREKTCSCSRTRVRVWKNPSEKTQGKHGVLPTHNVTDPVLADYLFQRGWRLRGIEEVSNRWTDESDAGPVRQHQQYLVFRFVLRPGLMADVRAFERRPTWEQWAEMLSAMLRDEETKT